MWAVRTGTHSRRYPYWVADTRIPGHGSRAIETANGQDVRKFATEKTAQAAADRMNARDYQSHEVRSARRHIAAAIQQLTRATNDSTPDDARIAATLQLADALEMIGGMK